MKKTQIVSAIIILFLSAHTFAAEKKDFGRKNILIGAGPATMKLMSAVASKADSKMVQVKPKIELRYPGKALKLLCLGAGSQYPDMVATTREMNIEEYERCERNNIGAIIKLKIGYEALVVATDKKSMDLNLNQRNLFLALANDVPKDKEQGVLQANPFNNWQDIDAEEPAQPIKIFGPADNTRDARSVAILGMEGGCRTWEWVAGLKNIQKSYRLYRAICHELRNDGVYVKADSAETDLAKQLQENKNSIGLIGFNTWQKSKSILKAYAIDDLPPTIGTISKGLYPLSRSLYVYIKAENMTKVKSLSHFMNELVSDKALGENGYLTEIGLVSMPKNELKREIEQASEFTAMSKPDDV